MCVLEPTLERFLTARERWIEYRKFNIVGLSRIKMSHDVIVLRVLNKLGYIVTSVYCQRGGVVTTECKAGECQYICCYY
jgi:hypothetical protein